MNIIIIGATSGIGKALYGKFKSQAGLNRFRLSAKEWTEKTNAIGIISKTGRYGGTYAHKDIGLGANSVQ